MKEQKLLVTMKDVQRYRVLKDVIAKKLKGSEAAELLNLSYIHISRLKKRLLEGGFEALLRKPPPRPPNQKISDSDVQRILKLRKEIYYDFNIMHLMDKLDEIHKMPYSYESIRQILIKHGLHSPKKKKKIHRQRRRMPKAGMLVQMDSSQHYWLPLVENKWWLIAMIDDATNEVPIARFFPKDTLFSNMHLIRRFIEIKGVFMSLYVDKASHFKTTRHGGLHYNVAQEQEETQIERALEELGINIIPANSPQAKGRIEVTFRLFQDRLIKEMRLAGIKNYDEANKFLRKQFLPWYNAKYTHKAESAYMPLPNDKNLDFIFCIKKERTVNNDNTVQIYGQTIQILPSKIKRTFAESKVDVCLLEDNRIFVLYKGSVIADSKLSKDNKIIQKGNKIERLLNDRDYLLIKAKSKRTGCKPTENHPWHSFRLTGTKYFKRLKVNI
jgi:transposase